TACRPELEKILHCLVTASLLRQMCQRFLQPGLYRRFAPDLIKIDLPPARRLPTRGTQKHPNSFLIGKVGHNWAPPRAAPGLDFWPRIDDLLAWKHAPVPASSWASFGRRPLSPRPKNLWPNWG